MYKICFYQIHPWSPPSPLFLFISPYYFSLTTSWRLSKPAESSGRPQEHEQAIRGHIPGRGGLGWGGWVGGVGRWETPSSSNHLLPVTPYLSPTSAGTFEGFCALYQFDRH